MLCEHCLSRVRHLPPVRCNATGLLDETSLAILDRMVRLTRTVTPHRVPLPQQLTSQLLEPP